MNFDFSKAFKQGIGAAEDAAKLNAEIDLVITEASRQIYEATDKQITISISSRSNAMMAIASMFSTKESAEYKVTHVIEAKNIRLGRKEDLADWERAPTAYPCKIVYSGRTAYCSDKASLEKQLEQLLSHPDTGKKMLSLLAPAIEAPRDEGKAE